MLGAWVGDLAWRSMEAMYAVTGSSLPDASKYNSNGAREGDKTKTNTMQLPPTPPMVRKTAICVVGTGCVVHCYDNHW